jgi:hypothetical protein
VPTIRPFVLRIKVVRKVKQYNFVGLTAPSGGGTANKPVFRVPSPMTRKETVLETLVYLPFNHLERLQARESFIEFSPREIFRLHKGKALEIFDA